MSCDRYLQLLSARLDGELTPEEELELNEHLTHCASCQTAAEELAQVHRALSALKDEVSVPKDLTRRVMERVERERRLARRRMLQGFAGLAACAAVCLGLWRLAPSSAPKNNDIAAPRSAFVMRDPAPELARDMEDGISAQCIEDDAEQPYLAPAGISDSTSAQKVVPEPTSGPAADSPQEPDHYFFANVQVYPVSAVQELSAPSAQILGTSQALADFTAQYPEEELEELEAQYGPEFFQTNRLLAVSTGEGSYAELTIPAQGLLSEAVIVAYSSGDEYALVDTSWVIIAEVDTMFDDGEVLEVVYAPKQG